MKKKNIIKQYKSNRHLLGIAILLFLSLFIFSQCSAQKITWSEIENFSNWYKNLKHKSLRNIKKKITKNNSTYIKAFYIAAKHKERKEYRSAARWFAKAYFIESRKSNNFYPASVYSYFTSFRSKFKKKSPFYQEILYELADCYYHLSESKWSLKFLALLDKENNPALKEKMLDLKGRIIIYKNKNQAYRIYNTLMTNYPSPVYQLRLAGLFEKKKDLTKTLFYYFKVLEFPKNDWTYKIATQKIISLLKKYPEFKSAVSQNQKVRLAEGYRILKKIKASLNLWKSISYEKLTSKYKYFYLQNYSRVLLKTRKINQAIQLIKSNISSLSNEEKYKLYIDSAQRMNVQHWSSAVSRFIPAYVDNKKVQLLRLTALHRLKSPQTFQEAIHYLNHFDKNSFIAERAAFQSCLSQIISNNHKQAISCLKKVKEATANSTNEGRSSYFLAREYEKINQTSQAIQYYKEVYLHSPAHSYVFNAFKALKRINSSSSNKAIPQEIKELRLWIASNIANVNQEKKFFQKKKENNNFAIDPYWKKWEANLKSIHTDLSEQELKGSLFAILKLNRYTKKYFQKMSKKKKYLLYQKLGELTQNTHYKYYFLKLYLMQEKKDVDVFLLSKKAQYFLFPTPYYKFVKSTANKYNIEVSRLYAIMKRESQFHAKVGSGAGAKGLMQLMPYTARAVNRKLKIKHLDLTNPYHSIMLGAKFYADMQRMFHGDFEMIAIAYNAGPGRLFEWKKRFPHLDKTVFLENIPYDETYLYVKLTKRNYDRYKLLLRNR